MMKMTVNISGTTIQELIQFWAESPGFDSPAFVSVDENEVKRSISRKDLFCFSKRLAYRLHCLGARKGTIICNALPNSLERIVCEFAIYFSGAISMNGQIFRTDGGDFLKSLETSKCFMVMVNPDVPNGARHILLEDVPFGNEDLVKSRRLPHLSKVFICKRDNANLANDFLHSLRCSDLPEYVSKVSPSDLATVMSTSGSTGYSKLVKLTHGNICHFCLQVRAIEQFNSGTRFINCAPLGWAGGYPQWYLSSGVTRYFLDMHNGPPRNIPQLTWATIVKENIEYGFLSPAYANAILSDVSLWQDASWRPRTLCLAGQSIRQHQLDIIGKLCDSVDINYGLTEANLVATHRITDQSQYTDGCAGHAGYGVHVKVVDEDANELPTGSQGELLVWSPALSPGYLNNESATQLAFTSDGWFHTDDAGYVGHDGKLYVIGRRPDCIMKGVYILYPAWLENELRLFPGVKDVVVVAVPDPVLHHDVCACVVTDQVNGVVAGVLHHLPQGVEESLPQHRDSRLQIVPDRNPQEDHLVPSSSLAYREHMMAMAENEESDNNASRTFSVENLNHSLTCDNNFTSLTKDVDNVDPCLLKTKEKDSLVVFEQRLRQQAETLTVCRSDESMQMNPRYYIFMNSLPLSGTGKLDRQKLCKIAANALKIS